MRGGFKLWKRREVEDMKMRQKSGKGESVAGENGVAWEWQRRLPSHSTTLHWLAASPIWLPLAKT